MADANLLAKKIRFISSEQNDEEDERTDIRKRGSALLKEFFARHTKDSSHARRIADAVEEEIYSFIGSRGVAYRRKVRELVLELAENSELVGKVLRGEVSGKELAKMTPYDLASEERKTLDEEIQKQNYKKAFFFKDAVAETDQFRCGKCKERRTTYYQLQTRSADEPMTTFVTCVNCGNKWKFS